MLQPDQKGHGCVPNTHTHTRSRSVLPPMYMMAFYIHVYIDIYIPAISQYVYMYINKTNVIDPGFLFMRLEKSALGIWHQVPCMYMMKLRSALSLIHPPIRLIITLSNLSSVLVFTASFHFRYLFISPSLFSRVHAFSLSLSSRAPGLM